MAAKVMLLRYAATCTDCGDALPVGTRARWNAEARSATCLGCLASVGRPPTDSQSNEGTAENPLDRPSPPATGEAGGSARREFEIRHKRREQKIDQRWGPLAGIVKFLSDDPQSTRAWDKGCEGERLLAARLLEIVGDRAVLLHDREVPRSRRNIDHIAIAASGVWVIDTKHYKGLVERRDVGGLFRSDLRLYVGGRNRTKLADGLAWQIDAVSEALGGVQAPVNAALCFVEAEWKLFARPFQHTGCG